MRVALTGLTIAEHFRDVNGQDVLLFIDNIYRFTQAGSGFCFAWSYSSAVGYNQLWLLKWSITGDHFNEEGFSYIYPSRLRACR